MVGPKKGIFDGSPRAKGANSALRVTLKMFADYGVDGRENIPPIAPVIGKHF